MSYGTDVRTWTGHRARKENKSKRPIGAKSRLELDNEAGAPSQLDAVTQLPERDAFYRYLPRTITWLNDSTVIANQKASQTRTGKVGTHATTDAKMEKKGRARSLI